jgi:hypothetical protein
MEWDELKRLLDKLEDTRRPSVVIDAITEAKDNLRLSFGDFIRMIILKDAGIAPKLNVVPPKKRVLLDEFLDEAYEYGEKGAFNHRDDPEMFIAYCSPYSDKRGMYLDELTKGQRTVIAMMNEDIMAYKKRGERGSQPNQSDIEEALNSVIRKKAKERREKSNDTTE